LQKLPTLRRVLNALPPLPELLVLKSAAHGRN
jgi:hypothetical protein